MSESPPPCLRALRRLRDIALPLDGVRPMFANAPILIAEDNVYLALDLSNALEAMDGRVVGPVSTVSEALFLLDMQYIAAAIIDCTLADRDAAPLVWQLAERGVPFVI